MVKRVALLGIFAFSVTSASACPDISGVYYGAEKVLLKIEQDNCAQLTKTNGLIRTDGLIQWISPSESLHLDGSPLCNHNACESATAAFDHIEIRYNYNNVVLTEDHGRCTQRGYDASKDAEGNLLAKFQVTSCADGFAGISTKLFKKY